MSEILQSNGFRRSYRKLTHELRLAVDRHIKAIVENPGLGNQKSGDLKEIFVYKFKVNQQEYLLAYRFDPKRRILLALGVHENFYRNLKKTMK